MMNNKEKKCFVISPIGIEPSDIRTHSDNVFVCIIVPALEKFGIAAYRADHLDEPGLITEQMTSAILEYDLCIAVLTGQNPNVFYELAIAQMASKPVILMIEKGEKIPFDVKDYRVVEYNLEPQKIFDGTWIKKLGAQIQAVQSENYKIHPLMKPVNFKPRKKIVFYAPTLKGNPFFYEILDHIVEISSKHKIEVIVHKAVGSIYYHDTTDHLNVLEEYRDNDDENTVVIMIPANPDSYNAIFGLDPDSGINLIALDMEVNEEDSRLQQCSFLKQVILINSEQGAKLAADRVAEHCQNAKLNSINVIVCEGEFHNRGRYFREYMQQLDAEKELSVHFLDKHKRLSFAQPGSATRHVNKAIKDHMADVQQRPTFIFCASDNLALGARISLSSDDLQLDSSVDIKIISFDASDVIRQMINLEDKYMFASIDQRYYDYADHAVRFAKGIFEGKTFGSKITRLKPKTYGR